MRKLIFIVIAVVALVSNQIPIYAVTLSPDEFDAITADNFYAPTNDANRLCRDGEDSVIDPGAVYVIADGIYKNDIVEPLLKAAFDAGDTGWSVEYSENISPQRRITGVTDIIGDGETADALLNAKYVVIALGSYELDPEAKIEGEVAELTETVKKLAGHDNIFWSNIGSNANGKNKDGSDTSDEQLTTDTPERYSTTNRIIQDQAAIFNYDIIDWYAEIFDGAQATDVDPSLTDTKGYLGENKLALTEAGADAWVSLVTNTIAGVPSLQDLYDPENGSVITDNPVAQADTLDGRRLPATRGGAGIEGNINDKGEIIDDNTGAPKDVGKSVALAKHAALGQEYRDYYITMRWRYATWAWDGSAKPSRGEVNWYRDAPRKVLVTNPDTGRSIVAVALEAGPAPYTGTPQGKDTPHDYWDGFVDGTPAGFNGRVAGFPPKAVEALGMVQWEYGGPDSGHERGKGSNLIYAWAPDQRVVPGPTNLAAELLGCYTQNTFSADGRVFPIENATKSIIKAGARNDAGQLGVWCYQAATNCHHDYNAADIHVPAGSNVIAMQSGLIVKIGRKESRYGGRVQIKGDDGFLYYYTHMNPSTIPQEYVANETTVSTGQFLGVIGTDDYAVGTAPHLHIDMLPPDWDLRAACSSEGCFNIPFIDIQPVLKEMYDRMPE